MTLRNAFGDIALDATMQDILTELQRNGRLDDGNSTFLPLGSGTGNGTTFTGAWQQTDGLAAISFFAFSDQPFTTARLEWSDDGVSPATGLLATQDFMLAEDETGGFYVYYPDPSTYLLRGYYRVVLENTGTDQAILETYSWTFPLGSQPFAFLDVDGVPTTLQKALLVKPVNAALDIVTFTDALNGTIPSGAPVTIDPVLNVEANVLDSGWVETATFAGKNIVNALGDAPVKVFLMNASDDQGANIFGDGAPTLTTSANFPSQLSALYADRYFRILVCNDSGSSLTNYSIRCEAAPDSTDGVTTGIDQPVFGFFPAKINRSVSVGRQPDGDYVNLPASGAAVDTAGAPIKTTTPLPAGGSYTSGWMDTDGFSALEVFVKADQPSAAGGLLLEFTDDANATTPVVAASRSFTYTDITGGRVIRLSPELDGFRVSYTNGANGQNEFLLDVQMRVSATEAPQSELNATISPQNISLLTRGGIIAENDAEEWSNVRQSDDGGLRVSMTSFEAEAPIKALSTWSASRINVATGSIVRVAAALAGRKTLAVKHNGGDGVLNIGPTASAVDTGKSWPMDAKESTILELDEGGEVWASVTGLTGGESTTERFGGSTSGNVGVTDPNNLLAADNARALFDAAGDEVDVTGFTALGSFPTIGDVVLRLEGRKDPAGSTTEQVTHVATVGSGQDAGTAVTSPTVTAGSGYLYVASISVREDAATVLSIVGLGLTWTQVGVQDNGGDIRTSLWYASGAASSGTVTANFSQAHDSAVIAVSSYAGVDLSTPVAFSEFVATSSTSAYNDTITGVVNGLLHVAVGHRRRLHTAASGATERFDVRTGTNVNDAGLAVTTRQLTTTGAEAYSGSLDGDEAIVYGAVVLNPKASNDPTIEVSTSVQGNPGSTLSATLTQNSDAQYTLDLTGDRAWTPSDIANLTLTLTAIEVGAAAAEIDYVSLEVTEVAEGGAVQVAVLNIGDD